MRTKNLGDSFLIVYESVRNALSAAAAIQARTSERNKRVSADRALALKIVINTGDVNVDDDGDVFGDPVNVCARMEKVATGGETLFSEAVYHSMNKAGQRFEEFGHYDFKGVEHPVRVYRVVADREKSVAVDIAIAYTDICGFMTVGESDPEAGERLFELHDKTIFPRVTRYGGAVQAVVGDACVLTFGSPGHAADCLLELFDELATHNSSRDRDVELRLACALHWGRVRYFRGRAMGDALSFCSRLVHRGEPSRI